jgi:hypothetical protein
LQHDLSLGVDEQIADLSVAPVGAQLTVFLARRPLDAGDQGTAVAGVKLRPCGRLSGSLNADRSVHGV